MFVYFYIILFSPCLSLNVTLNSLSKALISLSHLLSKLSQAHSLKLSPLCFTAIGPTRSSTSLPLKLNVTYSPADPLSQTPKPPINLRPTLSIRLRPTPPITSLSLIHFKSVVSVFFIYMLGIFIWI